MAAEKVIQMELDAGYYRMGSAALKSFLQYNPEWTVDICDLGLTAAQRSELEKIATISSVKRTDVSWPHAIARLQRLQQLMQQQFRYILHLDADTLTFDTIEPLLEQFEVEHAQIAMTSPTRFATSRRRWLLPTESAAQLYPGLDRWQDSPSYNFGVALMRPDNLLLDCLKQAEQKYTTHSGLFPLAEQSAFSAELRENDIVVMRLGKEYNYTEIDELVAYFNPPLTRDNVMVVIMHIPATKYHIFSTDGRHDIFGRWWRRWLDYYEEQPWPTSV